MEIEEKLKPNSEKYLREDEFSYWSYLPSDFLISVFECLGFADFQRAKSVCSSWHTASKQSVPNNNQIPWLILFPEEDSNNNSCSLFNPEEEFKLYHTQDLGVEFTKSVCLATCGCWLFMQDHRYNLFIFNLLTNERINLPPVESQLGIIKIERTLDDEFLVTNSHKSKHIYMYSPVLWIDANTKDYVVLWGIGTRCVVYSKKGDQFWNQIPEMSYCVHMVYKDHKLYFSSAKNIFRILDFSGEVPQEICQCDLIVVRFNLGGLPVCLRYYGVVETRLVVTLTGDVLRVNRVIRKRRSRRWSFYVYKVYSSGVFMEKPEEVDSLGDEAIVLDLGITVFANDLVGAGLRRNFIYFPPSYRSNPNDVFMFNMETKKMEKLHEFGCTTARLLTARWFLPRVTQTDIPTVPSQRVVSRSR